jgi:hypothetical protein
MPDMTAQQLITAAYRKNAIFTPTAEQLANGLLDLQNMLSSWSADGLIIPAYTKENFTLSIGQAVYTIGASGNLNTVRPIKPVRAFIRQSNNDYTIDVTMTERQYNEMLIKDLEGMPRRLYYDPQYPLANIKFDYEADKAYDFHLISEKPLTNPSALGTTFSIPLEVNRALIYNLAVELAPDNDNQLPREVFATAVTSLETLENNNSNEQLSSGVSLDRAITYGNWSVMNINAGE